MTPGEHAAPTHCANCGWSLAEVPRPRYCPRCGQATTLHAPTLLEFVHEFVGHYVALDGTLWRTLATLLLHPGQLTREYLAGRRRRYVPPLRLYLSVSFLFFLLVKVVGGGAMIDVRASSEPPPVAASSPLPSVGRIEISCRHAGADCNWLEWQIDRAVHSVDDSNIQPGQINRRLAQMAPYAALLMLPLYAGALALVYRRRRIAYGAHFVFSMHQHSAWFLVVLAGKLTSGVGDLLLLLYALGSGVWALHTVYRGRWWATAARAVLLGALYVTLFLANITALVAAGVLWA